MPQGLRFAGPTSPWSTPWGPGHPCLALAFQRNPPRLRVTTTSTHALLRLHNCSQRELLSRKAQPRQFLKKPQPCDGFERNSKATNTTTAGSACQSARCCCCCWKNCSAAMGSALLCHHSRSCGLRECLCKRQKSRAEGNQLYFSSLTDVARGFACGSTMFSTNRYLEERTAVNQC